MKYYQKIKNIREDSDIKQYELAKKIGVNFKTYNLYENGLRGIPYNLLSKILIELNLSLDYIFGFTNETSYPNLKGINEKKLSRNLRTLRKRLKVSQSVMASYLSCSQQTLSAYERGKLKLPIESLITFSRIVGISSDYITGRTKEVIKLSKNKVKS